MQMFDLQFPGCKPNLSICKVSMSWVAAMLCPPGISSSSQTHKRNNEGRCALVLCDCKAARADVIKEKSSSPEFSQLWTLS